jgi:hypothetical protein
MPGLVAAIITHLPNRKGYHAQRFEVIQECFKSLRENAGVELPLYVWDNGSDKQFRNWLLRELKPDYLTLSPNIGKGSARTAIMRSFPLETVVCFSDEDIYFYPGWLNAQLELLRGFPNVGAVSGCPIRTQFRWGNKATLKWAGENAVLRTGHFIPSEWEHDFCISIGRDWAAHCQSTAGEQDYLIEYNGLKAYATAHHMQFIGLAGKLGSIGSWSGSAMRDDQTFDVAIDLLGLLRLTTTERYTRHIGNVLEPMEQDNAYLRLPLP